MCYQVTPLKVMENVSDTATTDQFIRQALELVKTDLHGRDGKDLRERTDVDPP